MRYSHKLIPDGVLDSLEDCEGCATLSHASCLGGTRGLHWTSKWYSFRKRLGTTDFYTLARSIYSPFQHLFPFSI
ncbi:hypothetical protein E2C01_010605 [Portunus trituberculatus]|uniref:Uncharacterized protein n=1 Tax=Portunus trituberculatus TaxID=210409 RepID=A0A5B7D8X3_PORTR|nr:hypothetical protein [Portunus trituberculatus]